MVEAWATALADELDVRCGRASAEEVIPTFARFRPYLAHFPPVFSRFLRVFTVSTRRF